MHLVSFRNFHPHLCFYLATHEIEQATKESYQVHVQLQERTLGHPFQWPHVDLGEDYRHCHNCNLCINCINCNVSLTKAVVIAVACRFKRPTH